MPGSGNSFIPSGKTHLLLLSLYGCPPYLPWPTSSYPQVPRLGQCMGSVGGLYTIHVLSSPILLICSLMFQVLTFHLSSSLVALIGQYILNTFYRCLWRNVFSFAYPTWSFFKSCICRVALLYGIGLEYPDLGVLAQLATSPDLGKLVKCYNSFS